MREISRRGWPQTRQSSGKTTENRPQESFPAARSTTSGNGTQRPRLGRLLEKTHLHLTPPVYYRDGSHRWSERTLSAHPPLHKPRSVITSTDPGTQEGNPGYTTANR